MAQIIENRNGRRSIRLTTNDVISIVREYQNITVNVENYEDKRKILNNIDLYLPDDNI